MVVLAVEGTKEVGLDLAQPWSHALATGEAKLAFRKRALFHQGKGAACKTLAVLGLGKRADLTTERLRRVAAMAAQLARELGVASMQLRLAVDAGADLSPVTVGECVAEGLVLGSYQYQPPRQVQKPAAAIKQVAVQPGLAGKQALQAFAQGLARGQIAANATNFARDVENLPSNYCTPTYLGKQAQKLAGKNLRVKVLDRKAMAKLGMGAMLGVARGSTEPCKFLVLEYRVPGSKRNACIVGKGLTFDTGGISIKPAAKMDEMRYDMCGAGAVLGLFHALAHGALRGAALRHNLIGLIAATENMPGPDAQKPGDVVTAMDGQTIEVLNTDAEGRLVLADALCYAKRFYQPEAMVDLATLTGAVVVALGHECAGIMGNDQGLIDQLISSGKACDEPLWQLPLWECHREQMKSKFADLANINGPQYGNGSTAGGAFLSYFAGDTKWAHLDIAGAAYGGLAKDYYQSGASGTAVRTLLHWVRGL